MSSTTGTRPKIGMSSKAQDPGNHASTPLDDISFQWDGFTPPSQALPTSMKGRPPGKSCSFHSRFYLFFVLHLASFHFGDFSGAGWAVDDDEAAGLAMAGGGLPAYSFKSSPDVTSTAQPHAPKMTVNPKWHASCPPADSESSVAENSTLLGEGTDITADSLDRL